MLYFTHSHISSFTIIPFEICDLLEWLEIFWKIIFETLFIRPNLDNLKSWIAELLNSAKRRPRCRARGGMQEQQSALSCCCYWWVSTPRVFGSVDFPDYFSRFLAQELENVWLFRHCTSEQKFKSFCLILLVKTQNSNQFSVHVLPVKKQILFGKI